MIAKRLAASPWRPGDIQIAFAETLTSGEGFSFDCSFAGATTPIPSALPLFATGLGGLGLLSWRKKRKAQAEAN